MLDLLLVTLRTLCSLLISFYRGRADIFAENAVLRLQVERLREQRRPSLTALTRFFLVLFARFDRDWGRWVFAVQPETVLRWHRAGWRLFWKWKSRPGHPPITRAHIAFIRRMSSDHPEWGENKITEELAAKFGVHHSSRTIRGYMSPRIPDPEKREARRRQTWRTFIKNHLSQACAIDFTTTTTLFFRTYYVFAVMELHTRRILHWNITDHPTLEWVKIQIRSAFDFAETLPRFLLHDLDGKFGPPVVVPGAAGREKTYATQLDHWLSDVLGITGLPVPPQLNPFIERFWLTLKTECLEHFLFLGDNHLRSVLKEFIDRYYLHARPHQGIHGISDPFPELRSPPPKNGKLVAIPVLGGIHHDYRLVA